MRAASLLVVFAASAAALRVSVSPALQRRASAVRMQETATTPVAELRTAEMAGAAVPSGAPGGWQGVVERARGRAAAVKAEQDATAAAMALGTLGLFLLPGIANPLLDLTACALVGGGALGYAAGFREDAVGNAARQLGGLGVRAASAAAEKDAELGLSAGLKAKLPGGGGDGLTYADIKKFGVSGTVAYILTELAFWAVAFPVASFTLYNTAGHWPDLSDGGDRAAVLGFIFAGANVARILVPLRFGAAFAIAPWCDEKIVQPLQAKFGKEAE
jgi:hypothetical protein